MAPTLLPLVHAALAALMPAIAARCALRLVAPPVAVWGARVHGVSFAPALPRRRPEPVRSLAQRSRPCPLSRLGGPAR